MDNVYRNLSLRQAKIRSELAERNRCDCDKQIIPAAFVGRSSGVNASVMVNSQIVPVKMMSNGWVTPTAVLPIIISGGTAFFAGMPKGA